MTCHCERNEVERGNLVALSRLYSTRLLRVHFIHPRNDMPIFSILFDTHYAHVGVVAIVTAVVSAVLGEVPVAHVVITDRITRPQHGVSYY